MPVSDAQSHPPASRIATSCAIALLFIHTFLLSWVAYVSSPNLDEPGHLASGISHWEYGRFELYRVNPPLVRMVAAIPILLTNAQTDWGAWNIHSPYSRSEFPVGTRFVALNGEVGFWYFTLARWACIPLCLVGLWTVYLWAKSLYGATAGLMAMSLYCFCPNCVAWGASITPDAAGTSFGVLAAYLYWRWLQTPTWGRALQAGLGLGLAELAKGTLIVFFVVWPALWFIDFIVSRQRRRQTEISSSNADAAVQDIVVVTATRPPFQQLAGIILVAVYLLNLGFGFEGSFKPLRDYTFVSRALSGQDRPPEGANRFVGTWLEALPVPLPENYVRGLDVQKYDFERGKWSYLLGEQRPRGWWYYYFVAFLVKTPVCTIVMFAVATTLALSRNSYRSNWRNEWTLLLPAVVIMALVSSQTGFSRYLRYALPVLPFAYIHVSRVAVLFAARNRLFSGLLATCWLGSFVESHTVYPHSLSFFNVAVGGPLNGQTCLLDSNIEWGQDLLYLRRWYDSNTEARPLHLAFFGDFHVNPQSAGIVFEPVPGFLGAEHQDQSSGELLGPQPGWFAVSINHLYGYRHLESDRPKYTYFQRLKPVARAGYTIVVYYLTLDEANRLRADLGLDPIIPAM